MKIDLAHVRERSTSGGWINYAVFNARSNSGGSSDNETLLLQLTVKARLAGLRVEQSALAFRENGNIQFYGAKNLVEHLSRLGVPRWTHHIDV